MDYDAKPMPCPNLFKMIEQIECQNCKYIKPKFFSCSYNCNYESCEDCYNSFIDNLIRSCPQCESRFSFQCIWIREGDDSCKVKYIKDEDFKNHIKKCQYTLILLVLFN